MEIAPRLLLSLSALLLRGFAEATCTAISIVGERGQAGYGCVGTFRIQSVEDGWPVYRMRNHDGTCGDGEYAHLYQFKGHWLISRSLFKMPFVLVSAPTKYPVRSPDLVFGSWLSVRTAKRRRGESKYKKTENIRMYCTKRGKANVVANTEACKAVELLGLLPASAAAATSCNGRFFLESVLAGRFAAESGGRPVYRMYAPGARCGGRSSANAYIFFSKSHQMWIVGPHAYGPPFLLAKKSNALTPEAAQGHWLVKDTSDGVFRTRTAFAISVRSTLDC